ncbi:hypothetical protein [Paractinoplanes atraurantiacus]|uniref:Uncharacterized protein n=1 Tax=Paractinoplanes atraurantiacus TaxID=1036182 RepID=A0A285IA64_9ACTN|nr:hypothetical protein [Actinoplanes atraurantiacus]SNY44872.1 hypothetical protein SAMN05421748_107137 [Actinoplanes atraurantiacus]
MSSDPLDLDWAAVHHAYGPATDMPGLLRALRSRDEQRRTEAARQFRIRALHQDTLYPAAVAAAPYLIELLADDAAPDRTLGHELLVASLPEDALDRLAGARPHRLGPRLHEITEQRDRSGPPPQINRCNATRTTRSAPVCRPTCGCSTTPVATPAA